MNLVTISEITIHEVFELSDANADDKYYIEDVLALKAGQIGIADIAQARVNFDEDTNPEVRAIVGLNSSERSMTENTQGAVLPCPPYCGGKGEKAFGEPDANKNRNPYGTITVNFYQARNIILGE